MPLWAVFERDEVRVVSSVYLDSHGLQVLPSMNYISFHEFPHHKRLRPRHVFRSKLYKAA